MIKQSTMAIFAMALSGCAWLSADKNPLLLTENGLSGLARSAKLDKSIVSEVLGTEYHLIAGVSMKGETLQQVVQARKASQLKANFYADNEGKLVSIESFDPKIKTKSLRVGDKFSKLYKKAFNHCVLGAVNESDTEVQCTDPNIKVIQYTFIGQWQGPNDLIPSDNQLKNWTVSKITWFSQ